MDYEHTRHDIILVWFLNSPPCEGAQWEYKYSNCTGKHSPIHWSVLVSKVNYTAPNYRG